MPEDLRQVEKMLEDPRHYAVRRGVNVFDEHDETYYEPVYDDKGNPVKDDKGQVKRKKVVKKFTKDELQKIAEHNNRRSARGDLTPLAIGHTKRDPEAREEDQPELVGYAKNYRVEWDVPHKRWMLRADYYIRRADYAKAQTYPRTSIELYPASNDIDPISLIRRTPQRDLGQWVYSRDNHSYSRHYARFDPHTGRRATVLCYSMENNDMADAYQEPAAPAAPPESTHEEMVDQFARHVFSHPHAMKLAQHYAAESQAPVGIPDATPSAPEPAAEGKGKGDEIEPGAKKSDAEAEDPLKHSAQASATNGAPPQPQKVERAGSTDDEVKRMQRDQESIRYARLEKTLQELQGTVQTLVDTNKETARKYARSESEKVAQQLVYEGFDIDIAEEVGRMEGMTAADRQKHADYVRKYHRQAPTTPAPMIGRRDSTQPPMGEGRTTTVVTVNGVDSEVDKGEMEVLQFQRQHPGMSWERAEEEVAKQKANGTARK